MVHGFRNLWISFQDFTYFHKISLAKISIFYIHFLISDFGISAISNRISGRVYEIWKELVTPGKLQVSVFQLLTGVANSINDLKYPKGASCLVWRCQPQCISKHVGWHHQTTYFLPAYSLMRVCMAVTDAHRKVIIT